MSHDNHDMTIYTICINIKFLKPKARPDYRDSVGYQSSFAFGHPEIPQSWRRMEIDSISLEPIDLFHP